MTVPLLSQCLYVKNPGFEASMAQVFKQTAQSSENLMTSYEKKNFSDITHTLFFTGIQIPVF